MEPQNQWYSLGFVVLMYNMHLYTPLKTNIDPENHTVLSFRECILICVLRTVGEGKVRSDSHIPKNPSLKSSDQIIIQDLAHLKH